MSDTSGVFGQCFALVVGHEGGFTDNPADPGNWTSGRPGTGVCRGTKFGISAAAYPNETIAEITLSRAQEIYRQDYWARVSGDVLPPPLALLVFDAAVNNGVGRAVRWLQQAAGVTADGKEGPATFEAIRQAAEKPGGGAALCAEFMALRLGFMAALPTWRDFGAGWARRLCRLPFEAVSLRQ